jgi:hypothetical protein
MKTFCGKCKRPFEYGVADTWWDYKGSDYDTKLTRCKCCDSIVILGYNEHVNRDEWYYEYEYEKENVEWHSRNR